MTQKKVLEDLINSTEKELQLLDNYLSMINMQDKWTARDHVIYREGSARRAELNAKLMRWIDEYNALG